MVGVTLLMESCGEFVVGDTLRFIFNISWLMNGYGLDCLAAMEV